MIKFGYWKKEFNNNNSWHGGVATIEESKGDVVWGVVWKMDKDNLISLDKWVAHLRCYRPITMGCGL